MFIIKASTWKYNNQNMKTEKNSKRLEFEFKGKTVKEAFNNYLTDKNTRSVAEYSILTIDDIYEDDTLYLTYIGMDRCDRPVYQSEERIFVDTDPRKDEYPHLCTVLNNQFGGEPDTPISVLGRYKKPKLVFLPYRKTWD